MKKYQMYASQVALMSMLGVAGVLVSDTPVKAEVENVDRNLQTNIEKVRGNLKAKAIIGKPMERIGDYYIQKNEDGEDTATIVGYKGLNYSDGDEKPTEKIEETVVIPEKVGGYKITRVEGTSYAYMDYAKLVIPDSDIKYDPYTFQECSIDYLVIEGAVNQDLNEFTEYANEVGVFMDSEIKKMEVKASKVPDLVIQESTIKELDIREVTEIGKYSLAGNIIKQLNYNKEVLKLGEGAFYGTNVTQVKELFQEIAHIELGDKSLYGTEWSDDLDFREGRREEIFKGEVQSDLGAWDGLQVEGSIYDSDYLGDKRFSEITTKELYWNPNQKKMYDGTLRNSNIEKIHNIEGIEYVGEGVMYRLQLTNDGINLPQLKNVENTIAKWSEINGDFILHTDNYGLNISQNDRETLLNTMTVRGDIELVINSDYKVDDYEDSFEYLNADGDINITVNGDVESKRVMYNVEAQNINVNVTGETKIRYYYMQNILVRGEIQLNHAKDTEIGHDLINEVYTEKLTYNQKGKCESKYNIINGGDIKNIEVNIDGDMVTYSFIGGVRPVENLKLNVTGETGRTKILLNRISIVNNLNLNLEKGRIFDILTLSNFTVGGKADIKIGDNSVLWGSLHNVVLGEGSTISIGAGSSLRNYGVYTKVFEDSQINGDIKLGAGGEWTSDTWQLNGETNVQGVHTIEVGEDSVIGIDILKGLGTGESFKLGAGVTVQPNVFENLKTDRNIILEEPKVIEKEAFKNANIPNGVTIAGNQTTIGNEAFKGAEIGDLKLQGDFKAITGKAFLNAKLNQGKGLAIEGKVEEVSDYAFSNTEGKAGADLPYIHFNGGIDRIGDYGLAYTKVTDLHLQQDLQLLGTGAFYNTPLVNLAIAGNLAEVKPYALQGLNKQTVNILVGGNIGTIGEYGLANIYAEGEKKEEPKSKIQVNGDVGTVGAYGLAGKYKEVNIKGRIDKLGNYGLAYTKDQNILVEEGIRDIGSYAMYVKEPKKPIDLKWLKGTQFLRDSAFETSLQGGALEIPATVQYMGRSSFEGNDLTEVKIKAGLEVLEDKVFAGNQLTTLNLPSSLQVIGERATYGNNIACVTLPKATHTIGAEAFNQKTPLVIDVYGSSALKQHEAFIGNTQVNFIENSIFTNNCTVGEWQVVVIGKDTGGNILYTYEVDRPKQGTLRIEAKTLEKYKVKGDSMKTVEINEETPSHIVEFVYEGDNPVPPVEKPEPPVEKPEPPVEKPEPPIEKPEPPVEKPEPPIEKPEPPVEKPEPPVEKPEPPVEKPEPPTEPNEPIEKPEPPKEPNEPVEQPKDETDKEDKPIQKPIEKEETLNNNDFSYETEKEETLPKTGTEKERAGIYGLLLGLLGLVFIRKR